MKAFYSDTFELPLPERHRFPMAKYRLLRDRLLEERVLAAGDLHIPEPVSWADLRLVHDDAYVDAIANGALRAALWVGLRKPGCYDMQDVLGLK